MGGVTRSYYVLTAADVWLYANRHLTPTYTEEQRTLAAGATELIPAGRWLIAVQNSNICIEIQTGAGWTPINVDTAAGTVSDGWVQLYSDGVNYRANNGAALNRYYRRTLVEL